MSFLALAPVAPQAGQTLGGAQFQKLCALRPRNIEPSPGPEVGVSRDVYRPRNNARRAAGVTIPSDSLTIVVNQ